MNNLEGGFPNFSSGFFMTGAQRRCFLIGDAAHRGVKCRITLRSSNLVC
jgi:hypothetical protein